MSPSEALWTVWSSVPDDDLNQYRWVNVFTTLNCVMSTLAFLLSCAAHRGVRSLFDLRGTVVISMFAASAVTFGTAIASVAEPGRYHFAQTLFEAVRAVLIVHFMTFLSEAQAAIEGRPIPRREVSNVCWYPVPALLALVDAVLSRGLPDKDYEIASAILALTLCCVSIALFATVGVRLCALLRVFASDRTRTALSNQSLDTSLSVMKRKIVGFAMVVGFTAAQTLVTMVACVFVLLDFEMTSTALWVSLFNVLICQPLILNIFVSMFTLGSVNEDGLAAMMPTEQKVVPNAATMTVSHDDSLRTARQIARFWSDPNVTWDNWTTSMFTFPDPVNETDSRLHAYLNVTIAIVHIFLDTKYNIWYCLAWLVAGFALRVAAGPRLDPQAHFVLFVLQPIIGKLPLLTDSLTPGPPKRFAQTCGLVMSALALISRCAGQLTLSWILLGILINIMLIQAVQSLCLGCAFFHILRISGLVPKEQCERCRIHWVLAGATSPLPRCILPADTTT